MLVRELMSTTRHGHRPIAGETAMTLMAEHHITALPVVTAKGRIEGIVSEADLLRDRVVADPRRVETPLEDSSLEAARFVDEVMTRHVLTVEADSDVADAVDLFTSSGVQEPARRRPGAGGSRA